MLYRGLFKQQSNNKIVNIVIDLCIKDIEILRKYESIDKFDTIIGWSTGAQIAVTYVSLYNNLVNKLILLNPSIGMTLHTVLQPFIHLPINIGKYVSVLITNVVIGLKSLIPTIVYEILKYFFESTIFRIILEINAFIGGFPPEQGLYFHSYMYDAMSTRQHTQGLLNLILALDSKNPLDILIDKHIVIQQPTLIFSGYCDFITELDTKINKQRLLFEARCLARCRRSGIITPNIYYVDTVNCHLYMEYINGKTIKEILRSDYSINKTYSNDKIDIVKAIGVNIGKMHDAEIVHGDLTTSNILIRQSNENDSQSFEIVLIDFGLGMMKPIIEDKAVDLYVLERAFISTHPNSEYLVNEMLQAYRFACSKGTTVLQKLDQVRQRGRKREMFG
eukprot:gene18574-24299_t